MSSTTKKPKISEKNKEFIESLATTNDLYKSLDDYIRDSRKKNEKLKKRIANDISSMGMQYVDEIEAKQQQAEIAKQEQITEIFRKSGDRFGSKDKLLSLPPEEVQRIYIKAQESRKGFLAKFLDFLMSW